MLYRALRNICKDIRNRWETGGGGGWNCKRRNKQQTNKQTAAPYVYRSARSFTICTFNIQNKEERKLRSSRQRIFSYLYKTRKGMMIWRHHRHDLKKNKKKKGLFLPSPSFHQRHHQHYVRWEERKKKKKKREGVKLYTPLHNGSGAAAAAAGPSRQ